MSFDLQTFDVAAFDKILSRGLCVGLGQGDGQMCIEAAICMVLGLPHGDDPQCVEDSVRAYKISLNDSGWSSPEARAKGLRDLGIAQLGSKGVVNGVEFAKLLAERHIRVLIPALFRSLAEKYLGFEAAALRCEQEGTPEAARAAAYAAARAANAANATRAAAYAAADAAYAAADAAANATRAAADAAALAARYADAVGKDKYLLMSAEIALSVLRDLKSPGCTLISYRPSRREV